MAGYHTKRQGAPGCGRVWQDFVYFFTGWQLTVYRGVVDGATHGPGMSGLCVTTYGILYKVRLKKLTV